MLVGYYENQSWEFAHIRNEILTTFLSRDAKFIQTNFDEAKRLKQSIRGTDMDIGDPLDETDIEAISTSASDTHLRMALKESERQYAEEKKRNESLTQPKKDQSDDDMYTLKENVPVQFNRLRRNARPPLRYGMVSVGDMDPEAFSIHTGPPILTGDIITDKDNWNIYKATTPSQRDEKIQKKIKALIVKFETLANNSNESSEELNRYSHLPDPKNYKEAMKSPDHERWSEAIHREELAMKQNDVFIPLEKIPTDRKILGTKWVFKKKRDGDGNVVKYKARLVAQGFKQEMNVDYDATFSPTLGIPTLRTILALTAQYNLELTLHDYDSAYLNAKLDKPGITILTPEGFQLYRGARSLQLNKALYRLHQSGRLWHQTLVDRLIKMGYVELHDCETCVMVRYLPNGRYIALAIYVDDTLESWDIRDKSVMDADREELNKHFKLKFLGDAKLILGLSIERDRVKGTIKLHQSHYCEEICRTYGIINITPKRTPMSAVPLNNTDVITQQPSGSLIRHDNYQCIITTYQENNTRGYTRGYTLGIRVFAYTRSCNLSEFNTRTYTWFEIHGCRVFEIH